MKESNKIAKTSYKNMYRIDLCNCKLCLFNFTYKSNTIIVMKVSEPAECEVLKENTCC